MASAVQFATPLPQSTRSDVLEWRFPKPYHNYVLTGRSRAAWHTSFAIPQLNLLLDAGLCVNRLRPKHIFLTHGHSDHTLLAPAFGFRDDPPDVYCPSEMAGVFEAFCHARTMLNLGGLITADDIDASAAAAATDTELDTDTHTPIRPDILATHLIHPVHPGSIVPLRRTKGLVTALAFACDHSVPCLGYVFRHTTQKLKPEFSSLPGPELKKLSQSGVTLTEPVTKPVFAFLGDGTAKTLADGPEWLEEVKVVITECSFLYEEHRGQADKTKHTIWGDLEAVVRRWPGVVFVLTHFSMRYGEEEVRNFFKGLGDPPGNIVVWADGEGG